MDPARSQTPAGSSRADTPRVDTPDTSRYTDLPEVYTESNTQSVYAETHSTLPQVAPVEASHKHAPEAINASYAPKPDDPYVETSKGDRRICGLKRTLFFILAAIAAVLVIGAIVGGAVGGTLSKKSSSSTTTSDSTATTTGSVPSATGDSSSGSILQDSKVASANWTDYGGRQHYYVFHQNSSNHLIASFWDSQNRTWASRSISASLKSTGIDLDIIEGTPITANSWEDENNHWNIRVYVLLTGNKIAELYTNFPAPDSLWHMNDLGSRITINTAEGSNLAAWRPNGGNSSWPPTMLMWQDEDQTLVYSTSTAWRNKLNLTTATDSSGLAITSVSKGGNISDIQWRFYYDNSNILTEAIKESGIQDFEFGKKRDEIPSAATTNFAAVCFNLINVLVVDVEEDGGLSARWWDDSTWSSASQPTLKNLPKRMSTTRNFTAIAGHADRGIYSIVNGELHAWKFNADTPLVWTHEGQVNTTLDES
ncbi:hypothetical protein AUP68_10191 [Ilyonectria robusta]